MIKFINTNNVIKIFILTVCVGGIYSVITEDINLNNKIKTIIALLITAYIFIATYSNNLFIYRNKIIINNRYLFWKQNEEYFFENIKKIRLISVFRGIYLIIYLNSGKKIKKEALSALDSVYKRKKFLTTLQQKGVDAKML